GAHATCATSSSDGRVTITRWRFRKDFARLSSPSATTTTVGVLLSHFSSSATASLVEGASNVEASTSPSVPAWAWSLSAERSAAFIALLFTLRSKLRGVGGDATPPPVNWGARVVPCRAPPVPFWRHGFARPPGPGPPVFAPPLRPPADA